jgi:hypothetical protein
MSARASITSRSFPEGLVVSLLERLIARFKPRRLRTASRRVAIRAELAWHWQMAMWAAVGAILIAIGYALYDTGRRFGSPDSQVLESERGTLRQRIASMEEELERLRAIAVSTDSRVQVEKTAQAQLAKQLKTVEEENTRLKEELAFFENLVPGSKDDRMTIHRFRVEPNGTPGEYRYRMLVMAGTAREGREFNGTVQLVVNVQRDDRNAVIMLPEGRATDASYRLTFKRMQRVEGMFRVEPTVKVRTVQVRVLENGSSQPRATESYTLS